MRRLVVRTEHNELPVVRYVPNGPTSDVHSNLVDPSRHLTLVLSGHPQATCLSPLVASHTLGQGLSDR